MNKSGQAWTNVYTYVIILFLLAVGIGSLKILSSDAIQNSNANLDNDSIDYIFSLNNLNYSQYQADSADLENPILLTDNSSQGNPKDESIDFLYAKEKGSKIENVIKGIFTVPKIILIDVFRFNLGDWRWIITILNWLWSILITVALVYFIRAVLDK